MSPLVQSAVVRVIGLQLTSMDGNNSEHRQTDSGNAGRRTKSKSKKNYSYKPSNHGKHKRECDVSNKTDLLVQNVADKNNLQDTKVSTEIIFIINSNSM